MIALHLAIAVHLAAAPDVAGYSEEILNKILKKIWTENNDGSQSNIWDIFMYEIFRILELNILNFHF